MKLINKIDSLFEVNTKSLEKALSSEFEVSDGEASNILLVIDDKVSIKDFAKFIKKIKGVSGIEVNKDVNAIDFLFNDLQVSFDADSGSVATA